MNPPVTTVGILANPMSGRDVRRLAARASTTTVEHKRDLVARIAIGAAAAGAERIVILDEPFRISTGALQTLGLQVAVDEIPAHRLDAVDTRIATLGMRDLGVRAMVTLGGDGTNRIVAGAWNDAPLVAVSTGTNNVFPRTIEATVAGAAAGLVATGAAPLEACSRRAKMIHVEAGGDHDIGLIDAGLVTDDHLGNLMPFEPEKIRRLLLTRAEPDSVGMSPIGGMVLPTGESDDRGVEVELGPGGRRVLVPLSPGLYRQVEIRSAQGMPLGEGCTWAGPGLVELDGDRRFALGEGERAHLTVRRDGPRVVDVTQALRLGAESGAFEGTAEDFCARAFHGAGCC